MMALRKLVAGNWKMNGSLAGLAELDGISAAADAQPLVDEMLKAGASSVSRAEAGEWTTRVLLDPAGNEFCVIGPD